MGKRRKKVWIGVMIMAAATITATTIKGWSSPQDRKEKAARALEEKYHEEFEVISLKEPDLLDDYYTVQAYSVEYPNLIFRADMNTETGALSDEYVSDRVCARITEQIEKNLGDLQDEYYVFTEAMLTGTVLTDPEVSLEEFLKDAPNRFRVFLCIAQREDDETKIAASMNGMFKGLENLDGSIDLFLTDEALLEKIQEYVESTDQVYAEFDEMTMDAYAGTFQYEKGNISVSASDIRKMEGNQL